MKQIFYDPKTGQVMAEYRNCRYGGTAWQDKGYVEVEAPDEVTREHKVAIEAGKVVSFEQSRNPEQPIMPKRQPTETEVLAEALRSSGITIDMDAARQRLSSTGVKR